MPLSLVDWVSWSGGAIGGFTSRAGGSSLGPYAGLNLGDHVGDESGTVARNRADLAGELGVDPTGLVLMRQVHGAGVAVVEKASADAPEVDALVTSTPGVPLVVLVADCVPVLLSDPEAGIVAVAHAGRRGVAADVLGATLKAMAGLGARRERTHAVLGPAICGSCYEVPEHLQAEVPERAAHTHTPAGTTALDLRAALRERLVAQEVSVELVDVCTAESAAHYSYRRDGVTGRFAGVAMLERR